MVAPAQVAARAPAAISDSGIVTDADQRAAPVVQEHDQHEHHEQAPDEERAGEVAGCASRRSWPARKIVRVELDPGQTGSHLVDRRLDALGDLERVAPRQLLDDEHQARAVVDDRVADEGLVVVDHLGHVAEHDRSPLALHDDHLGQVLRRDDRQDVPDREPLVGGLEDPPVADDRPVRSSRSSPASSDVRRGRPSPRRAIRRAAGASSGATWTCCCCSALPPDRDVGDAGDAQQPRPDLPVRRWSTDRSRDTESEEIPMFITRRVADTGGIITGGAAQVGSVGRDGADSAPTPAGGPRADRSPARRAAGSTRAPPPTWSGRLEAGHAVQRLLERHGHETPRSSRRARG